MALKTASKRLLTLTARRDDAWLMSNRVHVMLGNRVMLWWVQKFGTCVTLHVTL